MAITSHQVVFFFRDTDANGWSEKYYYNGSVVSGVLPSAILALANMRMGLSTTSVTLSHIRLRSATSRNPVIFTPGGGSGIVGSEPTPTMPSNVCLIVRFNSNPFGFNRVLVRGIPERVVQLNEFVPDAEYNLQLNAWAAQVIQSGQFNAVGTLGSPTTRFAISAVSNTPPRGFEFNVAGTPVIAKGDVIRIHNPRVYGYAGLKTVVNSPVGVPLLVQVGGAAPPAADTSTNAYMTQITSYDSLITTFGTEGIGSRRTGRPFGVSRGRRQTINSLRQ